MRREDPGKGAGRSGRTRAAEAAGLAHPADLYGGTAVDEFYSSAAAAGPARTALLRDVLGGVPIPHRGVLSSGTADQLAALTARGAQTPSACIQFVEGDRLRLYGSWGVAADWDAIADTALDGSLGGLVV